MTEFICEYCNYSTKYKSDLTKHNNTKKHRNKLIALGLIPKEQDHIIQNNPQIIQNNPEIIPKVFKCDFCPKTFTIHSNKRRHEIHRCKENPDVMDKLMNDNSSKIKSLQKEKEDVPEPLPTH